MTNANRSFYAECQVHHFSTLSLRKLSPVVATGKARSVVAVVFFRNFINDKSILNKNRSQKSALAAMRTKTIGGKDAVYNLIDSLMVLAKS